MSIDSQCYVALAHFGFVPTFGRCNGGVSRAYNTLPSRYSNFYRSPLLQCSCTLSQYALPRRTGRGIGDHKGIDTCVSIWSIIGSAGGGIVGWGKVGYKGI